MNSLRNPLFLVFLFVSCATSIAQENKSADPINQVFANRQVAADAQRYSTYLKKNWQASRTPAKRLIDQGERVLKNGRDPRAASRLFATALAADDKNHQAWIGLARALLAIKLDGNNNRERYDIPVNASGAAYLGYKNAPNKSQKAEALEVLSTALQRRSYWRPALQALKTSLALDENPRARAVYEKLRSERGFRITNYKTNSETKTPEICLQFSESLSTAPVDFSKYISVDSKDPQSVKAEGKQLCIEGLTHGQRYQLQIRAGLPSSVGETLEKTVGMAAYLPDRKPLVRFTGRAYVLPSRGQQGIPIVSVNTNSVNVEIYRIGDRNLAQLIQDKDLERQLSSWDVNKIKSQSGARVFKGAMEVELDLNKEVTTAFPVDEALGTLKPGAYAMIARPESKKKDNQSAIATQWFIVSDLGLAAFNGADGVHTFVRSLSDATPASGVEVRLIAKNNEVLATRNSDASGYVRFDAALARGEGGQAPAILVAQNGATDYAFLDLTAAAFDLSDRGVKGRNAPGETDGYLYLERGVYRPGQTVHLSALVRDRSGKASSLPVTLIVSRPDGVEDRRLVLPDQGLGGRTTSLALHDGAMTGTWRAKIYVDPKDDPISQAAFLVEDFVPERLDMTLQTDEKTISPTRSAAIIVEGKFLYGPPAAQMKIDGEVIVKVAKGGERAFPGYSFGTQKELVSPVRHPISQSTVTDDNGKAKISIALPRVPKTAKPLEANVVLRLRETGGRTIERNLKLPVALDLTRIGVKPLFEGNSLAEDQNARFDVIVVGKNGERIAQRNLSWTLSRIDTSWQWYNRDGYWSYEAITVPRKVESGTLDVASDAPAKIDVPVKFGRYRLDVATQDGNAHKNSLATTYAFTAGWYTSEDQPDTPEFLDVALDKPSYKPGEEAKLRIATKHGGHAIIAVLNGGLKHVQHVDVGEGSSEVALTVGDDWGAGAYVTALLYRPIDVQQKRMPGRAIGLQWLKLDQEKRTLSVSLGAPQKVKSGGTLDVPLTISGLKAGEEARVTVAAVDVGILNLTRFKTPAPETWFYAQTKLSTELRDFYGRLIDGMRAERGALRSGGDGPGGMQIQGSPPVEQTLAEFSGIVSVGAGGKAKVQFELPDFNGSVRLMAVAWSTDKLGHASRDIIVRDKLALTASGPRFLTLGDEAQLSLDIHNVEGETAIYSVIVNEKTERGPLATVLSQEIQLKTGERRQQSLVVKPAQVDRYTYDVRISGPGGVNVARTLNFDVKPPAGDVKRTTVSSLSGNGGKLTISDDLVHDLIRERTKVNISVGPTAKFDVPAILAQLDRYPYGCAEQTVSRALPLVYANALSKRTGIATDSKLKERIGQAIERVFQMQDASGAFGSWGPSRADMWLTAYVTDFLTRAKEAGHNVKPRGLNQALDRLQNFIAYAQDFDKGGEDRAYALYVLARNGRAPAGELRYYSDARLERFSTPLSKAQLGAALAMVGDNVRAKRAFAAAINDMNAKVSITPSRTDYGSRLRDGAAFLTLASETKLLQAETASLVDVVATAYQQRAYTSTQEQAWMLLAANSLAEGAEDGSLTLNGQPFGNAISQSLSANDLSANPIQIVNNGEGPVDAMISIVGASLSPQTPVSKGFTIERKYFSLDGTPVEFGTSAKVKQNDRIVTVVSFKTEHPGGRILLVDRLPAGLEIENPRLVKSGDIKSLAWLKSDIKPEHTEFRDDRFVAAFDLYGRQRNAEDKPAGTTATVAYIVRAVTTGSFVHPAATVEDMYRPERHARTQAGQLIVERAE